MTHLTLPWPHHKIFIGPRFILWDPCFRLCDPPHGFQSQSGSVTCLHAVNLRVKSGAKVPTWTGKPGKVRKLFPVKEKSGNFEQTGKVREFCPKCWKNEEILASFYHNFFLWLFGSFGNEPVQSCSVCHVSLSSVASASSSASVYSPPSDRFDHRSFISYKYMQLCP